MFALKRLPLLLCIAAVAACSSKPEAPVAAPKMPPAEVSHAWLDEYHPKVEAAIAGSGFTLERKDTVLIVTAPADSAFNKDSPSMLMPSTLGPFSRLAKLVEADQRVGLLILGHADSVGEEQANRALSRDRAAAVTAIFRLSGLKQDRLWRQGVGSDMPRAANDSAEGRALNRRVEIVLTRKDTLLALIHQYNQPATAVASSKVEETVLATKDR